MKKIIVIDASSVVGYVDGLSQYIVSILGFLPEESFDEFTFRLLVNKDHQRSDLDPLLATGRFDVHEDKIPLIGPKRDWWFYKFLKKYNHTFDLMHITSTQYPLALKKGVGTIHDMILLHHYYKRSFFYNAAPVYFRHVVRTCVKNAKAVIAVSNATKNEVVKLCKANAETAGKISVIYEGWEHLQMYESKETAIPVKDYIFYLGSSRMHKNLARLVRAFAKASKKIPPHINLVISGEKQFIHHLNKDLSNEIKKLGDRIFFTGYLEPEEVAAYYKNADFFILPSLMEGFGIPVLESFYYNTPLLCSDISSLPEVAGDAALFFNPYAVDSIAGAITKFYEDENLRKTLVEKGRRQLQKFSWKTASAQTVDVYRDAFKK